MLKKIYLPLALLFVFLAYQALKVDLPTKDSPLIFYSNQVRKDLKWTLLKSLNQATNLIYLSIYSLTDPKLISLISKKAEQGLDVQILVEQKQVKSLTKKVSPKVKIHSLKQRGLMHQKIFLVDQTAFIGSTNLTQTSLRMHDNLMAGFYFPGFSEALKKNLFSQEKPIHFSSPPLFEFSTLPNPVALEKVLEMIHSATHSIYIAMFTFTHPRILEALSQAHKRGVYIHVLLDYLSHKGASKKMAKNLKDLGIKISHNRGVQMMHHKLAILDQKTVIMGSTNWTQSAFEKNQEALLFFYVLKKKDLKLITQIWENLVLESKPI